MSKESKTGTKSLKISENNLEIRNRLWPQIKENTLWHRKRKKGYVTIPRTMPYILKMMDEIASPTKVSGTYFTLWCHVYDESLVKINVPRDMAFEAGFSGQRAEITWRDRMKKLKELGFIDTKEGSSGPYHYVLIFNPYTVIESHKANGRLPSATYNVFLDRTTAIGALES